MEKLTPDGFQIYVAEMRNRFFRAVFCEMLPGGLIGLGLVIGFLLLTGIR